MTLSKITSEVTANKFQINIFQCKSMDETIVYKVCTDCDLNSHGSNLFAEFFENI